MHAVLADRAERRAGEHTVPPPAHQEKIGADSHHDAGPAAGFWFWHDVAF
jgi:hypothetical protein